jgi:hypothetical protein
LRRTGADVVAVTVAALVVWQAPALAVASRWRSVPTAWVLMTPAAIKTGGAGTQPIDSLIANLVCVFLWVAVLGGGAWSITGGLLAACQWQVHGDVGTKCAPAAPRAAAKPCSRALLTRQPHRARCLAAWSSFSGPG